RDRLVQARARALGAVRPAGRPSGARARRREPLPRRRSRDRARPADGVDQPPRRGPGAAARHRAALTRGPGRCAGVARVNVRSYTSDDAAAVAALVAADEERLYGHESHIGPRDVAEWTARAKEAWVWE